MGENGINSVIIQYYFSLTDEGCSLGCHRQRLTGFPLGPSSPGGPLAPAGPAAPGGPASPFSPSSPLGP